MRTIKLKPLETFRYHQTKMVNANRPGMVVPDEEKEAVELNVGIPSEGEGT